MFTDLHLHTTYSDGSLTPNELIKKAKELGYSAIAVTDHDTVKGIDEAIKAGQENDLEVIPGIEFNTRFQNYDVHILGYLIDYDNIYLLNLLNKIKKERKDRIKKMLQLLKDLYGFEISLKEIKEISANNIIGRSHIARLLIEKGYLENWSKIFDNYIGKGQPAYIDRKKITPFEAIDIIKKADGIPVIAHPGLIENNNLVQKIVNYGIDGIEVYYPEHNDSQTTYFKELAEKNELLITGGSDCHGPHNKDGLRLGQIKLDYSYLKEMKNYKSILNHNPFKKDLLS